MFQNALLGRLLVGFENPYQLGSIWWPFPVLGEDVLKRRHSGNSRFSLPP
jgi:hypothetical protein